MFYISTRRYVALCIRRTLCRRDYWYTNGHFCCFDCLLTVFGDSYTVGTVLADLWRFVHQWFWLFWRLVPCTNRQKQSKDSQNSKNDHWCTNRHMSTETVPTVYQRCTNRQKQSKRQSKQQKWPSVYQSSHVYTESAEYTKSASASAE